MAGADDHGAAWLGRSPLTVPVVPRTPAVRRRPARRGGRRRNGGSRPEDSAPSSGVRTSVGSRAEAASTADETTTIATPSGGHRQRRAAARSAVALGFTVDSWLAVTDPTRPDPTRPDPVRPGGPGRVLGAQRRHGTSHLAATEPTCSTAVAGRPVRSLRSRPGSKARTTDDVASGPWTSSPRPGLRWSADPQTRPDNHQPPASTRPGAVSAARRGGRRPAQCCCPVAGPGRWRTGSSGGLARGGATDSGPCRVG